MKRALTTIVALACGALSLVGCGANSDVTLGSANFAESQLLSAIYAGALKAKGISVSETPPLGSREAYIPALQDGSIDLIPEYTGTLLSYFDIHAPQTEPAEVYAAVQKALPAPLTVLEMSQAQDRDAVVVPKAIADKYNAKSMEDLAPHCGELAFGGPPEFQRRSDGIPGIQKVYNCTFKSYTSLDAGGPLTLQALRDNQIQAADIFTTDPSIPQDNLVALTDPKSNFAAQNVVPLINSTKATPQVRAVLNEVSSKLTTEALIALNAQFNAPDKPDQSTVAAEWLKQNGLG
ncbi:ABC transporter substrate-binding protein [Pseudonocardia spinosispora]|uniref:ABC transporter substrate-binding protein n=1 Tax=Pseudonocardia spinosispora TaxID=103441 RepID=UPI0004180DFB|nr:ABC transporter substrate-binding protein [Pseudonocardia spinosispora]